MSNQSNQSNQSNESEQLVKKMNEMSIFFPPMPGYNESHNNLEFIQGVDGTKRVATMYYKVNDEPEVLLYSHGNASDIGAIHEFLSKLAYCIGINIISYDYEGYGLTDGIPSEEGCVRAIDIVYAHLISNGRKPSDLILYGMSIGTGPTVDLASRILDLKGVVLQAPFTKIIKIDSEMNEIAKIFKSDEKIGNIKVPVTIIHGKKDEIIPHSHATTLLDILSKSNTNVKLITLDDGMHNNIDYDHYDTIVSSIIGILEFVGEN